LRLETQQPHRLRPWLSGILCVASRHYTQTRRRYNKLTKGSLNGKRQPQYLFPASAKIGGDNLVLHAIARRHVVNDFSGPLSIKSVIRGEVNWIVDGRHLHVDP